MIRLIEELSASAWPAPTQIIYDGWIVRFGGGYTRRANSVHPFYPGGLSIEEKIETCQRWYRQRGLPAVFKLTEAAEPQDLDSRLRLLGYGEQGRTSVQIAPIANASSHADPAAHACEWVSEDWLSVAGELNNLTASQCAVLEQIAKGIAFPARYVVMREGKTAVVCGMAVAQDEYLALFDIVTRKEHRRRGWATRLLQDLLNWGRNQKAEKAYLQVVVENDSARRLYRKLGFAEAYQYWYRVRA